MSIKHTPGPWKAGRRDAYEINITSPSRYIADIYNNTVKVVNGYPIEAEADANAALIAAAPKLLALIKEILEALIEENPVSYRRVISEAQAAIIEAEGGDL